MTLAEALNSVRFIVDRHGRQTDVVLPLEAWEALIAWLEDQEDISLLRERWASREMRVTWPTLEEVESELADDESL